ncbi:hypothetical protein KIPB_007822 [Kipferlia bialata]|uniref:RING-type domain-containing protein n=1 Tax=Kipferlia bialata TaxID=797122 RepID=A0A9K3D0T8_9EUKA|nr:hypothetical protein KIPB_007822 [Kipferlia bialata]|eukprot:g7822.t1
MGDGTQELACSICLEDLADVPHPVVTQCGHFFCKSCLDAFQRSLGGRKSLFCPTCRQPLPSLSKPYITRLFLQHPRPGSPPAPDIVASIDTLADQITEHTTRGAAGAVDADIPSTLGGGPGDQGGNVLLYLQRTERMVRQGLYQRRNTGPKSVLYDHAMAQRQAASRNRSEAREASLQGTALDYLDATGPDSTLASLKDPRGIRGAEREGERERDLRDDSDISDEGEGVTDREYCLTGHRDSPLPLPLLEEDAFIDTVEGGFRVAVVVENGSSACRSVCAWMAQLLTGSVGEGGVRGPRLDGAYRVKRDDMFTAEEVDDVALPMLLLYETGDSVASLPMVQGLVSDERDETETGGVAALARVIEREYK